MIPMGRIVISLLAVLIGGSASALTLEQVLAQSARAMPALLVADARVAAARGELLAAEGRFDRRFELDTDSWVRGYYDGLAADARFSAPIANLGADVYAGYRVAGGAFPVYQDERITQSGGEFSAGVNVPLLRGRATDSRRQGVLDARLGVAGADAVRSQARLEVQHAAAISYWRWLASGLRLAVYRALNDQAEARDRAFRERLRQGSVARIDVVENARALLRRRELVRQAELELELDARGLSLYLRDASGRPVVPGPEQLAPRFPDVSLMRFAPAGDGLARALAARPELRRLAIGAQRARARERLAGNEMLPSVDLGVKLSQDLGTDTLTRDEFEWVAALEVSVPVERRQARGRRASARAELDRIEWERRLLEDRIGIEYAQIRARLEAAAAIAALAEQEADLANQLEVAERQRFDEGASTFFLVNQREQVAADARLRVLDADRLFFEAVADFWLATADAKRLGLAEGTGP